MLSSKNEDKQEARFAARLDVLMERIDTLASTVASTASAIAKKDGEIAALQRALEARDQTLQALVQHVNRAAEAPLADVPVDATELRSLRNAIAALNKERAGGVNAASIEHLVGAVRALDERLEALAAAVAAPPVPTPDPTTIGRIEALASELGTAKSELSRPSPEVMERLSTLAQRVDTLDAREAGVTPAQLGQRLGAAFEALSGQSKRLDTVVEGLEELEQKRAGDDERVERRLGRTDAALDDAARRLDTLSAQSPRLDALAATIGELERMRNADDHRLRRHLDATEAALAEQSRGLDSLAERLGVVEQARAADEQRLDHRREETEHALKSLSQRVDALPTFDEAPFDRRLERTEDTVATLSQRVDAIGETFEALMRTRAGEDERLDHRFGETRDALAGLSQRIDAFRSVDETQLDRRFEETDGVLTTLSQRLDTLAETVEAAAANLGDKERELTAAHRSFTESSTRIESIVGDIREALHALPEQSSPSSVDELVARLERLEVAARKSNETTVRAAGELHSRIDLIDHRVATVAEDVSRAKTLWPVALRSLEARLDDAVHGPRVEPIAGDEQGAAPSDDLVAGLRDSLREMESVANEMARAADTLTESVDEPVVEDEVSPEPSAAAAAGATVVPLRASEP